MSNKDWYSAENWYAPLKREEAPAPKKKKRGRGWLITGIIVGVLALIAGSTFLVNRFFRSELDIVAQIILPEADTEEKDDKGMPKDWKSYLDDYYTAPEQDAEETMLEKVSEKIDYKLYLYGDEGKNELTLQELYEKCSPTVVTIKAYDDSVTGYGWATGVIVSSDGLIVTNAHVVNGFLKATVALSDDREFEARLVGSDTLSDIALIKIDAQELPVAELGDSGALREGDRVAAIGNPLGETFRFTMTDGIVSAIERDIVHNGHSMSLIQTNTAINEGNSGGPLLNMYGQVVGIVNMKMMSAYSSVEGIGFAIPTSTVCSVVNQLIEYGEVTGRVSLGITVGTIPTMYADYYKIPQGLYVSSVSEKSDAAAQGIRHGDILTAVNGNAVIQTSDVTDVVSKLTTGDTVILTVWRDGEYIDFTVKVMKTKDVY